MVNLKQTLNARYELKQLLGSGGMARVYLAHDSQTDQLVAVKILHPHLTENAVICARFKREAKVLATLDHPNIIRIHDYDVIETEEEVISYIVMDYLNGKSLQDILTACQEQEELLSPMRILQILDDLASALDYSHSQHTIHRDIKPSNVMFKDDGQAVLMDFGLARIMENSPLTQENTTLGTPAYMSPEQIRGDNITAKADLYSLGILFYEMTVGSLPYQDTDTISILLKHLNSPAPSLASDSMVGVVFNPVLAKALAKDPSERYESARAFVDDVRNSFNLLQSDMSIDVLKTQINHFGSSQVDMTVPIQLKTYKKPLFISIGIFLTVALIGVMAFFIRVRNKPSVNAMIDVAYVTEFDHATTLKNWQPFDKNHAMGRLQDGLYQVTNLIPNTAIHTTLLHHTYQNDISITMQATLSNGEASSAYGIIFNYQDDENFGVFAVDGMGRFSIWQLRDGRWEELRNKAEEWTPHPQIKLAGEANTLRLEVGYDGMVGFVNNRLAFDIPATDDKQGKVGFYLASTAYNTEATQIEVERFQVLAVTRSMTAP